MIRALLVTLSLVIMFLAITRQSRRQNDAFARRRVPAPRWHECDPRLDELDRFRVLWQRSVA